MSHKIRSLRIFRPSRGITQVRAIRVLLLLSVISISVLLISRSANNARLPSHTSVTTISGDGSGLTNNHNSGFTDDFTQVNFDNLQSFDEQSKLLEALTKMLLIPPTKEAKRKCEIRDKIDKAWNAEMCHDYIGNDIFSGPSKDTKNIVHFMILGFDTDILEIAMEESRDLVDYYVLVEGFKSHKNVNGNFLPKMLLWERLKYQDRFKDYRDKVVHIVLDDTAPLDIPQIPGTHWDPSVDGRWKIEHRDNIAGFRAFLAWNQTTKFLTEGDVFISGSPDEIPSRDVFQRLKYCNLKHDVSTVGIWFVSTFLDRVFKPDWNISGHPWAYSNPTIYRWPADPSEQKIFDRKFGKGINASVIGGAHLSNYAYAPYIVVKHLTCTECANHLEGSEIIDFFRNKDYRSLEVDRLGGNYFVGFGRDRNIPFDELRQICPWARWPLHVQCNPNRFPRLIDSEDPRTPYKENVS